MTHVRHGENSPLPLQELTAQRMSFNGRTSLTLKNLTSTVQR